MCEAPRFSIGCSSSKSSGGIYQKQLLVTPPSLCVWKCSVTPQAQRYPGLNLVASTIFYN